MKWPAEPEGAAPQPVGLTVDFDPSTRFALYYAPPASSPWWQMGCAWLQRDPASGAALPGPAVPGLSRPLADLTSEPRRYGWHATLVAPFTCRPGVDAEAVLAHVTEWAGRQAAFALPAQVAQLERFVAIQPAADTPGRQAAAAMHELAAGAVHHCADLRAAPSEAELAKRRRMRLSARQEALLLAWGYPFVLEEFRFHLTLSNPLEAADAQAMMAWWNSRLLSLGPLPVESVALYVQPRPGQDFLLWCRVPLGTPARARS